jgi:hypothetical protein
LKGRKEENEDMRNWKGARQQWKKEAKCAEA